MMTPNAHIREVLRRDTGWVLRGGCLVLELHSLRPGVAVRGYMVAHFPDNDTWERTYLGADELNTPRAQLRPHLRWHTGRYSAAAAADEVEKIVRVTAVRQVREAVIQ